MTNNNQLVRAVGREDLHAERTFDLAGLRGTAVRAQFAPMFLSARIKVDPLQYTT
jgi:hypothetical protein